MLGEVPEDIPAPSKYAKIHMPDHPAANTAQITINTFLNMFPSIDRIRIFPPPAESKGNDANGDFFVDYKASNHVALH